MKNTIAKLISIFNSPVRVNIFAIAAFFIAGLILVFHHEMWRDEMHAWLVARESTSLLNLYELLKYEGHPGLWHLILMPITRLPSGELVMQLVHLLIATFAAWIFLSNSPFTQSQRILFIFGYFPFFEYSIIARNYGLGILFIFIFCTLYSKPKKHYLWISITIALMANTSLMATIIALSLLAVLLLDCLLNNRYSRKNDLAAQLIALFIGGMGTLFAIVQMTPPPDSSMASSWIFKYGFGHTKEVMATVIRGYLPLPIPISQFWNSNIFLSHPALILAITPLAAFFIYKSLSLLSANRSALLLYILGSIGLLGFFYTKYLGYPRHHGFLYIILVASLWIAIEQSTPKISLEKFPFFRKVSYSSVFTSILWIHVAGSVVAFAVEYQKPFSNALAASEFIRKHHLESREMVGYYDYNATPIAGYLNKPFIYFPESSSYGNYVRWDTKHKQITTRIAVQSAIDLQNRTGTRMLLIMGNPVDPLLLNEFSLEEVAQFTGAIVVDENIYLYQSKMKSNK